MASFNRIIIAGNLTRDPEHKQLASGQAVCRLSLASNRQFRNKQTGSMVQEVCYVDIDVWGPQAESCKQYLQKGRPILVEGRLKLDSWEDQGQKRSKHTIVADRVVFLGSTNGGAEVASEMGGGETTIEATESGTSARIAPQDPMEQELFSKIESIKNSKKAAPKPAANADVDFKDEPPFQDDLPF